VRWGGLPCVETERCPRRFGRCGACSDGAVPNGAAAAPCSAVAASSGTVARAANRGAEVARKGSGPRPWHDGAAVGRTGRREVPVTDRPRERPRSADQLRARPTAAGERTIPAVPVGRLAAPPGARTSAGGPFPGRSRALSGRDQSRAALRDMTGSDEAERLLRHAGSSAPVNADRPAWMGSADETAAQSGRVGRLAATDPSAGGKERPPRRTLTVILSPRYDMPHPPILSASPISSWTLTARRPDVCGPSRGWPKTIGEDAANTGADVEPVRVRCSAPGGSRCQVEARDWRRA
jgi:hypothetical protein